VARPRRASCRRCARSVDDAGPLSKRGICADCGRQAEDDNYDHLTAHDGVYFEHWRRRTAASLGATLLDDL
jgi:hypothetical protein